MAQQEPRYAVDATAVIGKLKTKIADVSYELALAESAIDDLLARQDRLVTELQEANQAKADAEKTFKTELASLTEELNNLREMAE
jgi:hypothetical protein